MTGLSDSAKKILARLNNRNLSTKAISTLINSQTNENYTPEDIQAVLSRDAEEKSVPKVLIPTKPKVNGGKIRDLCSDLINEVELELRENPPKDMIIEGRISPLLLLSDLHFGEVIHNDGDELFNFEIAEKQFETIIHKACGSPELMGWDNEEITFNVLLAGDIIDGELIYPAQSFETDGDAYSQFQRVAKVLWKSFRTILSYGYSNVNVFCVAGNHGRASKLHSQMSNWDNAIYYMLAMMAEVSDLPIVVVPPKHMWADFKIKNTTVHTRHIGVLQASSAGPNKKLLNWILGHKADIICFGHYHNPEMFSVNGCRVFKNGSLPPMNDFAENLGFADGRGQWLLGISDNGLEFSKILQGHNG